MWRATLRAFLLRAHRSGGALAMRPRRGSASRAKRGTSAAGSCRSWARPTVFGRVRDAHVHQRADVLVLQAVIRELAVAAHGDQPAVPQQPELVADRGGGKREQGG